MIGLDEYHKRTFAKTISWRVTATITTMTIVFVFTRKIMLSIGVGLFEVVLKILFYYLHERMWTKVSWGKKRHPLDTLPVTKELEPEDMAIIRKKLEDLGCLD